MTRISRTFAGLALSAALGSLACGTTLAPKELMDARDAYDRAAKGPAAKLTPAQLDTAKQALDQAETSFKDDGDEEVTKTLAYIAMRKAQVAAAQGEVAAAAQRRDQAARDLQAAQLAEGDKAKKSLAKTKAELEEEKRKLDAERKQAEADRKMTAAELAKKDQEVKKTQKQLEEEQKKRAETEKRLSAAMASLAEVAKIKEEKRGVVITISGEVLFASGKYELLPIAKSKLDDVAKALKEQGFKAILVEGHTDSRGTAKKNEELSFQRADAVRAYLVSQGIPSDKIKATGIGPSRPIATNDTAEGRANNRRVELIVTPE
ncbi:MAG: OmpA family protein [Myxococcales bacterium]|nr:OmpA family protein [Myxococcales bacterium]